MAPGTAFWKSLAPAAVIFVPRNAGDGWARRCPQALQAGALELPAPAKAAMRAAAKVMTATAHYI